MTKKINNLEHFLKEANALLEALNEYDEATARLAEIDLRSDMPVEELAFAVSDIELIIEEREEIKSRAETSQTGLVAAIEEQDEDSAEFLNCVFEGKEIKYALTGDRQLAKEVVYKLIAIQKSIMEKDAEILEKFSAKQKEIKETLKNLQGDKKKLDFLSLTASGTQDSPGFNV